MTIEVLLWRVSQKKQKRPQRSLLVDGFKVTYKVENKVEIALHFECSALTTLYISNKWTIEESDSSGNVFILRLALLDSCVTANAFALKDGLTIPVWNNPEDRVSDSWRPPVFHTTHV